MASNRALAVLAAVAAALVVAVIWDLWDPGAREAAPATRRLLPGCEVTRVRWERPQQPPVILERAAGDDHALRLGRGGQARTVPVDPRAARDVLGTLELLAYRRAMPARRAERGLDSPRLRVHVTCAGGETAILALGERLVPLDRVWLARMGEGAPDVVQPDDDPVDYLVDYLIEGYAARALDRAAGELRARRVFARLAPGALGRGRRVEIRRGDRALILSGDPARVHLDALAPGARVRADPDRVSELVGLLRELAITRFVDDVSGGGASEQGRARAAALAIRVDGAGGDAATLEELGACPVSVGAAGVDAPGNGRPGLRLVRTGIGTGCVSADVLASVAGFVDAGSPGDLPGASMVSRALVDPSAALARVRVESVAGPAFTLHSRGSAWSMSPWDGEGEAIAEREPAEPAAVRDWLTALDAAAGTALVPASALDVAPAPALALTVTYAGDREERVVLYADPRARPGDGPRWLARRDQEPVYLVLDAAPHTAAITPVSPLRFRRRALLAAEPFAVREVIARESGRVVEHLVRGQLLDEWSARVPAGAEVRAGVVDALRDAVTRVRARRFVAATPQPAHGLAPPRRRVEAVLDPGPLDTGAPRRHRLDLGVDTEHGCLARLDQGGPVFELDRARCDALRGPWTTR